LDIKLEEAQVGNEREEIAGVGHPDGLWARTANLLLGGWLVFSAFAWDRGAPRVNAAVVGYLVFVFALLATALDGVRALSSALGLWLLASVWLVPAANQVMRWNTGLVGVTVLLLSLVSSRGGVRAPPVRMLLARLTTRTG
jgi:hypothetical protein